MSECPRHGKFTDVCIMCRDVDNEKRKPWRKVEKFNDLKYEVDPNKRSKIRRELLTRKLTETELTWMDRQLRRCENLTPEEEALTLGLLKAYRATATSIKPAKPRKPRFGLSKIDAPRHKVFPAVKIPKPKLLPISLQKIYEIAQDTNFDLMTLSRTDRYRVIGIRRSMRKEQNNRQR